MENYTCQNCGREIPNVIEHYTIYPVKILLTTKISRLNTL